MRVGVSLSFSLEYPQDGVILKGPLKTLELGYAPVWR